MLTVRDTLRARCRWEGTDNASVPRLANLDAHAVRLVEVFLPEHRFRMTGEAMGMLRGVYRLKRLVREARGFLADQAQQRARLQKELKKLDLKEERLVDLAAEGALATDKLRARLRDLQIKKHEVRASLETTTESLKQRTQMVLSYLDLMARPDALFTSVSGSVRRKLLAAFFQRIWVDDDGHLMSVAHELQPLPAAVRHAALAVTTNERSAGEISDASSAEHLDLHLKVICSSNTSLVEPLHHYSNNSALLPPPLVELKKLADLVSNPTSLATPVEQVSRSLRRRLEPALVKQIATEYEAGATTPSLCDTYGLSKTGILRLLRDEGVVLRRRPLTSDQVALAKKMYEHGHPIAAIATRLDTSYNNVRQRLIKDGVQLRPRGGSCKDGSHLVERGEP